MIFRYIAGESHCTPTGANSGVRITGFGSKVDLDAEMAHICISGRMGLLPEELFDSIGFTDDELEMHSDYDRHKADVIDPSFAEKKRKSHAMFVKYMGDYVKAADAGDTFMARAAKAAKSATPMESAVHKPAEELPAEEPPVEHDFEH